KEYGSDVAAWIGISDKTADGTFAWANGDPVLFTRWAANEPVNTAGTDSAAINIGTVGSWATAGFITNATNAGPIVITSNTHGLTTGTQVQISGVLGNTAANGTWTITVVNSNSFSLNGSTGNGAYTSGGTWTATLAPAVIEVDGTRPFTATHQYATNASYPVSVTVADKDGATTSIASTSTVTITTAAPTVTINGAPASSPEGTGINLTSTVSDPGGPGGGFIYAWSVTKNGSAYASGSASALSFTPDDNGTYVVTLTVTATDGGSSTTSK